MPMLEPTEDLPYLRLRSSTARTTGWGGAQVGLRAPFKAPLNAQNRDPWIETMSHHFSGPVKIAR